MAIPMAQSQETPEQDSSPEQPSDAPNYLVVGRVVAVRGLSGEMRVDLLDPDGTQFLQAEEVYLGEERLCLQVRQTRLFRGQGLLQVEGIDDRNAAEYWRNAQVGVVANDVAPLEEDEYYYRQVLGLSVITEEGENLGHVTHILATRANDVYVVQGPDSEEILLPAIKDVILKIDPDGGTMLVRLLEGLRD